MSAMDDFHFGTPARRPERPAYSGLRNLLLATCLTVLAALALQSLEQSGAVSGASIPVVQDWKGNSGSLPDAR